MIRQIKNNQQDILLVCALFLIVFTIGADSFIISPLLPTIQANFGISLPAAALSITIYALCYAIGSPFLGPLGDHYDKRRLLIIGISVFLLGSILCAVATNIAQFYIFRALAGIGAALTLPNVWAIIGSHFQGRLLNTVMGITMSALSLSIAVGIPVGTAVSQLSNWHMVFWASAGLTVIAMFVLIFVIPNDNLISVKTTSYLGSFRQLFKTKHVLFALSVNLLWMFGFYTLYTFLGTYISTTFHYNTGQIGVVFIAYGLSNFISSFGSGQVTSILGPRKSVLLNGLLSAVFIFALTLFDNKISGIIVFLILLAAAQRLGVTALSTYIVSIAPRQRSAIMAFNSSFIYLGLTLGSGVGGIIYARWTFTGIGIVASTALFAAALLSLLLRNK